MDSESSKTLDIIQDRLFKKQGKAGIPVSQIIPNSPAAIAGIKPGDLLIAVDNKPLLSMQDYVDASSTRGTSQVFDILRNNTLLSIKVDYQNA